ncbi:protein PHYLLO, chloroplastic-like [Lathyrus oleraceus]|uniref:protein PHYLLO, chloroplastic-like n=1 Tax=Pisum sativum TaxID=3888 RepID=UPI0021D17B06|nr:protein PHYLLO, chloroplastic-like [Pisum sativum]
MEDNWPDEDVENELSPIAVHLGYVQQLLGRKQDAIEAYVDMTKQDTAAEMALRLVRPARKTKTAASEYEDDILKFCEESGLPVAQDETVDKIQENPLKKLLKFTHPGIVAVVIKPSVVGGFENAEWAHQHGKTVVVSSAFESNLSLSA